MKPIAIHITLILGLLLSSCDGSEHYVSYSPPIPLPIIISIDSSGKFSVAWEGRIQTPIGTFTIGTANSINLKNSYSENDGVLIVSANGMGSVYDLQGVNDISIKLDSGYYKQIELRKEGKNWYFEAVRITDSPDASEVEITLTNDHCETVDFYVDGEIAVVVSPETTKKFNVKAGDHNVTACVSNTQNCGNSGKVVWENPTRHTILRGANCDNVQGGASPNNSTCNKGLDMINITPHKPTLKPKTKFTVILNFYNPNDCDLRNIKYTVGWNNDLSGPSGFSIPIIYAKSFTEVTLNLIAPAQEGNDYFTFYNSGLTICKGLCEPAFIYANVKKD